MIQNGFIILYFQFGKLSIIYYIISYHAVILVHVTELLPKHKLMAQTLATKSADMLN